MAIIIDALIEIGLIRADYKHHKKIRRKEKKDGIKRPFQRFFLQPSTIVYGAVLCIGILIVSIYFWYQRGFIFPQKTKSEIAKISVTIEEWNKAFDHYPVNLQELIGNNPIRKNWDKDAWGVPYLYIVSEDKKEFQIVSAGSDHIFDTEDDLKSQ